LAFAKFSCITDSFGRKLIFNFKFSGLRKFRRQLTIEEQIQRTQGGDEIIVDAPPAELLDESDDIDVSMSMERKTIYFICNFIFHG
jgi:hypothetical protein